MDGLYNYKVQEPIFSQGMDNEHLSSMARDYASL
jgi:hypothetical protein